MFHFNDKSKKEDGEEDNPPQSYRATSYTATKVQNTKSFKESFSYAANKNNDQKVVTLVQLHQAHIFFLLNIEKLHTWLIRTPDTHISNMSTTLKVQKP